jgi:hypothetical protein
MQVVGNIKYVCPMDVCIKTWIKKSTRQHSMAWFSKQQMRFMNFIFFVDFFVHSGLHFQAQIKIHWINLLPSTNKKSLDNSALANEFLFLFVGICSVIAHNCNFIQEQCR